MSAERLRKGHVRVVDAGYGTLDVPTRWRYAVLGRYGRQGSGYLAMERGSDSLATARRHVTGNTFIVDTTTGETIR